MSDSSQRWVVRGQNERLAAAAYDDYPSRELLATAKTLDQREWWEEIYHSYQAIRECWLIRIATASIPYPSRFDPLLPLLDAKEIDQLHYDLVWCQVDEADNWFSLIAACIEELNAVLASRGCAPMSPYAWFVSMRQAAADNLYRVCLLDYVEVAKTDVKQSAEFFCHLQDLDEKALKSYGRRAQRHHPLDKHQSPETPVILPIVEAKAVKEPEVGVLLDAYKQAKAKTGSIMSRMLRRTRDSETFERPRAMAWFQGKARYGEKHGGTYG
jgi:hypothetical protein